MDRVKYEEELIEIDLREYMRILWNRKWLIIGLVVIALIASYFLSNQMTRIYQTSVMVMIEEGSGTENILSDRLSILGGQGNKIATYREMLRSRRTLQKVITELGLRNRETGEYIKVESLKDNITINVKGDTKLIDVTVNYPDPEKAARIANTLIAVFKRDNLELKQADLKGAADFITDQLQNVEKYLADLEKSVLEFKETNDIYIPEQQGKDILERLTELESGRLGAELKYKQIQAGLNELKKYLAEENREIITTKTITDNPVVQNSESRLADLELELAGLREIYTEKHPQVIELKARIENVKERLRNTVEEIVNSRIEGINPLYQFLREEIIKGQTEIISSQVQIDTYKSKIKELKEHLAELPAKELELTRLQRESKVTENIYLMLRQNREEIQLQQAMRSSDIVVIDPAVVKDIPVKPSTKLNMAIAAFLALFIGIGLIFLREYLDTTIKGEDDIEKLTGLPVLGVIPRIDKINHSQNSKKD